MATREQRRIAIRQRVAAIAREERLPEGMAPTERQFVAAQRHLPQAWRLGAWSVLKAGGALGSGSWPDAMRGLGLIPASEWGRPSREAVLEDLLRVAGMSEAPRLMPATDFYREHGRFEIATVLKYACGERLAEDGETLIAGERTWTRAAAEAGLEPRTTGYGELTREGAIFHLRRLAAKLELKRGGRGPTVAQWTAHRKRMRLPSAALARSPRLFGSWGAFLEAAGFNVRPHFDQGGEVAA